MGAEPLAHRLRSVQAGGRLEEAWHARFDEMGFASLQERIVQATTRETILQLLRELGSRLRTPARVHIGGLSSLLLADLIVRRTEHIDFDNELPEAIRSEPVLVDELARKYSLRLAHFASHYLPDGWESRARVLGSVGRLEALVADPLDVLCGKLFSRRAKDFDDLRAAGPRIDQQAFRERVRDTASNLRSDSSIAEQARHNWYILTGEASLP